MAKKQKTNNKKKTQRGITLIALVITIIVLLILAGVSITMITGNNSILNQATSASRETAHANVYEQLQLKAAEYYLGKNSGDVTEETLIKYLQKRDKRIISDELGEGSGKYQIYVENLLGTTPTYGKGTASGSDTSTYKDVYILEKVESPEGASINNIKIASTKPIRIAANSQASGQSINYTVKYYGTETGSSNGKTIGNIGDTTEDKVDIVTKINEFINDPNAYQGDLEYIGMDYYRDTHGKIYKATYAQDENENWIVTKAEPVNLDATIDSETQTITTPFGTYQKSVEGEENNDSTWKSHTDVNGNKIYVVYNENDGFEYEYDASGKLVMVHEALM